MLDDFLIIHFQGTIFPGKDISKLFHWITVFRTLVSRQMCGQIYVSRLTWTPYMMLTDCRLIFIFGSFIGRVILVKQSL